MRNLTLAAVAAMMVSGSALAGNMGASVNYGLGGVGADLGYAIVPDFVTLRAGLNAGRDDSGTTTPDGGTTYDYKLDTSYQTLGLDWHPFGGSFRLSAGYAWSNVNLDVIALAASGATVNGVAIPAGSSAAGKVEYKSAPFVSFGWGNHAPRRGGFFFNTEFGVMLTGKPDVSLATSDANFNNTNAADIEAEKQKIKNDAMDFFPIVKLGAGYTF